MNPGTVILKYLVKDHILFHQLKPLTIEITSPAFRKARMIDRLHFGEEKRSE